jgi:hypothetical protein
MIAILRYFTAPATILVLIGAAACTPGAPATSAAPTPVSSTNAAMVSGEQLVQAMYDRYAGKWYKTLTFVQRTDFYQPDGSVRTETWLEAASLPGKLRIDIEPRSNGNGILFRNDSIFNVQNGTVARSGPFIHPLLVLGFDVYGQPAARSIAQLRQLGFDLSQVHTDTWEGRPVYVVGAAPGDLRTKQFWVDQERLLFVRMLQPVPRDSVKVSETRFSKYVPAGQTWIAPEVEFITDGTRTLLETYSDVRVDVPLDEALFDPARWNSATHWAR